MEQSPSEVRFGCNQLERYELRIALRADDQRGYSADRRPRVPGAGERLEVEPVW